MINALKTYENSIRHKASKKYMVAESLEDITEATDDSASESSRRSSNAEVSETKSDSKKTPVPAARSHATDKVRLPAFKGVCSVRVTSSWCL